MLEALRKSVGSWVVKIFLGLLVLSFAVWGVADIFGNYGTDSIAKVGETEVATPTFQNAYQRELNQVANRVGRQLTPDEARALGIDRRVLSDLLTTATLVNQASQLNLGISDDYLADEIVESPEFRDAFGRFDRSRFEQILASNGLSETGFVAQTRNKAVRDQIALTVAGTLPVPETLKNALNQFQNGQRVVEYFTVPPVEQTTIPESTADDLSKFYDANKPRFTLPEFRELSLLVLDPEDLALTIEVSEEDIETEYEARRAQYETPETRSIDQMFFSNAEKAAEANAKIQEGADFMAVAEEYGYSATDIDLGTIRKEEIVDEKVADAAFSLEEGAVSEPVEGLLGTAILRVRDIQPGVLKSLEEVSGEIRERIAEVRARDEAIDFYESVEDERAGGLTLAEIADKMNLQHVQIEAIDRGGKGPDGNAVAALPENPEILRVAFESEVGFENDPVDMPDGGFVWVSVNDVRAPELQTYETVASEVERLWREDRRAAAMREKAQELIDRGREGVSITGLADDVGATVETSQPFARNSASAPFDNGLVQAVFATPQGGLVRGHARDGDAFLVARVKEIVSAEPIEGEAATQLETNMKSALEADLFEQYVSGLQSRFGVSVNTQVLGALTGGTEQ